MVSSNATIATIAPRINASLASKLIATMVSATHTNQLRTCTTNIAGGQRSRKRRSSPYAASCTNELPISALMTNKLARTDIANAPTTPLDIPTAMATAPTTTKIDGVASRIAVSAVLDGTNVLNSAIDHSDQITTVEKVPVTDDICRSALLRNGTVRPVATTLSRLAHKSTRVRLLPSFLPITQALPIDEVFVQFDGWAEHNFSRKRRVVPPTAFTACDPATKVGWKEAKRCRYQQCTSIY